MGKKKERIPGVAYGKTKDPEIMRELRNEEVIEMLGGVPIYVHSNVQNAKIGLKTAEKMVDRALDKTQQVAKAELDEQLAYLANKRAEVEREFGNAEKLRDVMEALSKTEYIEDKIKKLLDLKLNATALSRLQKAWKERKKETGSVTIGSGKNKAEINLQRYSEISSQLRENMAKLINTMAGDKTLNQSVQQYVAKWMATLTKDGKVASAKFNNREMSKDIGWFLELVFNDMKFPIAGTDIKVGFKNLSVGFKKTEDSIGAKPESYNKSDTLICFYRGDTKDPFVSFPVSDKTGMEGHLKGVSTDLKKILAAESVFTANIHESFSPESKPQSRVIGGELTDKQYGVNFTSAARYILGNTEIFIPEETKDEQNSDKKTPTKKQTSDNKLLRSKIAAVIMWSAAIVEITGLLHPNNATTDTDLPLFIRHFDKLYYTEDILKNLKLTNGLDIIKSNFVNQEYITNWIMGKVSTSNPEALATKLWEAKHEYIYNIIKSHSDGSRERVTYEGLRNDPNIKQALNAIYDVLEQKLALSIAMRIQLKNYKPLF